MPRTPALGHIQAQGERDTQGQNLIDAENLQQEKEITSQVEGRLTVARLKLFENSVKVGDLKKKKQLIPLKKKPARKKMRGGE